MAHAFGEHEGCVVSVGNSNGSAKNNWTEAGIEPGLGTFVRNQISGESIYICLDVQIVAMGSVVVDFSHYVVEKILLHGQHPDVGARLIQLWLYSRSRDRKT